MEQVNKCLSPDLHGLLHKFVNDNISSKQTNFEKFGNEFFEQAATSGAEFPRRYNRMTKEAMAMLSSDPGALYKLVECDPDILYLRDRLKFLVLSYLINNPSDLTAFGLDYFKNQDDPSSAAARQPDSVRRFGVATSGGYDPETEDPNYTVPCYKKTKEELENLRDKIRHALLFRSLDEMQMKSVLGAMFKLEVPQNSYVIRQGDDGDYFYVVDSGKFEAYVKDGQGVDQKVSTYNGNGSFGELALLYNMPRVATVKAMTDGTLWCLDRDSFRKIVVRSAFKKRQMYEKFIANVPMLRELNDYERHTLADALQSVTFDDGECIIKQSDDATGMYFVEEGVVLFSHVDEEGKETKLSKIREGGYFGELALVTKKARAVSAYASGRVHLAFVDKETFERLLGPCHDIMKRNIQQYEMERQQSYVRGLEMTRSNSSKKERN